MSQQVVTELLAKRRDRVIATILGQKERELDAHLPKDVSLRFRKVVLEQVNDFYSVMLDILSSVDSEDQVVLNEFWLDKIDAIYSKVMMVMPIQGNGHA